MATFTIVLTDAEKGVLEIDVTSDPKIGPDDDPTIAQRLGLAACEFMAAMTAHAERHVVNTDGAPVVTSPFEF